MRKAQDDGGADEDLAHLTAAATPRRYIPNAQHHHQATQYHQQAAMDTAAPSGLAAILRALADTLRLGNAKRRASTAALESAALRTAEQALEAAGAMMRAAMTDKSRIASLRAEEAVILAQLAVLDAKASGNAAVTAAEINRCGSDNEDEGSLGPEAFLRRHRLASSPSLRVRGRVAQPGRKRARLASYVPGEYGKASTSSASQQAVTALRKQETLMLAQLETLRAEEGQEFVACRNAVIGWCDEAAEAAAAEEAAVAAKAAEAAAAAAAEEAAAAEAAAVAEAAAAAEEAAAAEAAAAEAAAAEAAEAAATRATAAAFVTRLFDVALATAATAEAAAAADAIAAEIATTIAEGAATDAVEAAATAASETMDARVSSGSSASDASDGSAKPARGSGSRRKRGTVAERSGRRSGRHGNLTKVRRDYTSPDFRSQ
jgi:hypothetical protein